VRIAELETELANISLAKRLTEAGLLVDPVDHAAQPIVVRWSAEHTNHLLNVVNEFIFSEWLYGYIEYRARILHPYLSEDEREYITLLTLHGLRRMTEPIASKRVSEWIEVIRQAVADVFVEGETAIHMKVDGVMRFRARDYLAAIDDAIREIVEQFLSDREYEEFVSMLRYMLDAQPASAEEIHLYCTDERIWMTDPNGTLIQDREVSAAAFQVTEDEEVNAEDLTMSVLITRSPCNIVIHDLTTAPPWPSFAETVERVFLERSTRCENCSTCAQLRSNDQHIQGTSSPSAISDN
jgi:putative sporulation protein YtxC